MDGPARDRGWMGLHEGCMGEGATLERGWIGLAAWERGWMGKGVDI